MIHKLFGCLSVFLGVLWLLWPQLLRGWLVRKASWTIFWALFFSFFFPFAAWAGEAGLGGWGASLVVFVILGSLLRNAIGRAAEKVPLSYFRIAGALNIASGLSLIFLRK